MEATEVTLFQYRERMLDSIERKISQNLGYSPERAVSSCGGEESEEPNLEILLEYAQQLQESYQSFHYRTVSQEVEGKFAAICSGLVGFSAATIVLTAPSFAYYFAALASLGLGYLKFLAPSRRKKLETEFAQQRQEIRQDALLQFYGKHPGELIH